MSRSERQKSQENHDRQKVIRLRGEINRIVNKPFDVNFVHDESSIERERWKIMRDTRLGTGSYWELIKIVYPDDARDYAVKICHMREIPEGYSVDYFRSHRLKMLQALNHPKLFQLRSVYQTNDGEVYIIFVTLGHNKFLSSVLTEKRSYDRIEAKAKAWIKGVAEALSYLHNLGISFGPNLTVDNLMTDERGGIKILGLELYHKGYETSGAKSLCNIRHYEQSRYLAPEVLRGVHDETPVDVFRLGVITYHIITGNFPFSDSKDVNLLVREIEQRIWDNGEIKGDHIRDLLSKMFIEDVVMRITIDEVLKHPWITGKSH